LIGFADDPARVYAGVRRVLQDRESLEDFEVPASYMFHGIPSSETPGPTAAVEATLAEMDRHGIEVGLVSLSGVVLPARGFAPGGRRQPAGLPVVREMRRARSARLHHGGHRRPPRSLRWIFTEMREVPFATEVWPRFLRGNASGILKLGVASG